VGDLAGLCRVLIRARQQSLSHRRERIDAAGVGGGRCVSTPSRFTVA
jgi:hypothetical protein